jgi:hypothetical protein
LINFYFVIRAGLMPRAFFLVFAFAAAHRVRGKKLWWQQMKCDPEFLN